MTCGLAQPNTCIPAWGDPGDAQVPFTELLAQLTRARAEFRPVVVKETWPVPAPPEEIDVGRFHVISTVGNLFDPAPGFLRPKNFNNWDQERMTLPERAWPPKGSAGHLYDRQRKGRPPWKPTQEHPSDIKFEKFAKMPHKSAPASPSRGHPALGNNPSDAFASRPSSGLGMARPASGQQRPTLSPRAVSSPVPSPRCCTPFSRPPSRGPGTASMPASPASLMASGQCSRPNSAPRTRDPAAVIFQKMKPKSSTRTTVVDVGRPTSAIGRRSRPSRLSSPRAR
mmetsp:Transcript_27896/g.64820  ORF Transcript_27896/g.64820 Transcript_27896/m.64820 type:complete len:283 (-) Transcript_27896:130-978(-)